MAYTCQGIYSKNSRKGFSRRLNHVAAFEYGAEALSAEGVEMFINQ
jgi:hypothetical protein